MSKSILQDKERNYCFLCAGLENDFSEKTELEEHHVFGGPNRKLSEKYGLKVYLCRRHHTGDISGRKDAVHAPDLNCHGDMLKRYAQGKFEELHGHSEFMRVFGRNYL